MRHRNLTIDPDNSGLGHTTIPQLCQLLSATWDGNCISKTCRDELIRKGLADRVDGWTVITIEGLRMLSALGIIKT